jgi:hypothetical protein
VDPLKSAHRFPVQPAVPMMALTAGSGQDLIKGGRQNMLGSFEPFQPFVLAIEPQVRKGFGGGAGFRFDVFSSRQQ